MLLAASSKSEAATKKREKSDIPAHSARTCAITSSLPLPIAEVLSTSMKTMLTEFIEQKWCSIRPFLVNSASSNPSGLLTIAHPNRDTTLEKNCRCVKFKRIGNLVRLTDAMYRLLVSSLLWYCILPYCNDALRTSLYISLNTFFGRRDRKTSSSWMSLPLAVGSSQEYGAISAYLTLLNDAGNLVAVVRR